MWHINAYCGATAVHEILFYPSCTAAKAAIYSLLFQQLTSDLANKISKVIYICVLLSEIPKFTLCISCTAARVLRHHSTQEAAAPQLAMVGRI